MLTQREIPISCEHYAKHAVIYTDPCVPAKAAILYFHGGGLLYGSKTDLPEFHLTQLTQSGFAVISYDYPLSPAAKLPMILDDVCDSINHYIQHSAEYLNASLPYFLWGRSAGAYLCLIACASSKLLSPPKGILSYYGYGFLCDNWFQTPSAHYLSLPMVDESCFAGVPGEIHADGALDTHYSLYVYARQTGKWTSLLYEGREKFFYLYYSLRACSSLPCPIFCAHSTNDPDVPFDEFLALCSQYHAQRFIASCNVHDFDRDTDASSTHQLLSQSIAFLDGQLD